MNRFVIPIPLLFGGCLLFAAAARAELPPDVLAKNRWVQLTRADYERQLERVPEKMRFEFAASPKRVQDVLNNLLLAKTLAAQARAHGTRPDAGFAQGAGAEDPTDRALADAELRRVEADAGKAFDAQAASFEAKARELYRAGKDEYREPEAVRLSDIAVLIKDRGDAAARARAAEARAKIVYEADFASVAREYSDDPTTKDKGGALPFVSAKGLAPDFAKGVFALTTPGELSGPIKGGKAYHVVRLEERRPSRLKPFEEVRESIMRGLRERYMKEQRDLRIRAVFEDPSTETNQPAIDALVNKVDPGLFRKDPRAAGGAAKTK